MIIIISVIFYSIVVLIALKKYANMPFSGNEAAGNAIAKGLTFFYGLGIIFLIAVFLTIINAFFYKGISNNWIKFLFFIPIGFPLLILTLMFFNVRLPPFQR
ncbi:hypothetical protein [Tenacibaculum salmonis]|uniref:hypothetical protein n=1 Tax=Tenacibaculum sp. P3-BQ1 TaxID=3232310 RepID=UPI0034DE2D78